jgi:hypothetical protein
MNSSVVEDSVSDPIVKIIFYPFKIAPKIRKKLKTFLLCVFN